MDWGREKYDWAKLLISVRRAQPILGAYVDHQSGQFKKNRM
jgi:hypothetical protein